MLNANPDLKNCHCERNEAISSLLNEVATPACRDGILVPKLDDHSGVQARTFQDLAKKKCEKNFIL